MSYEDRQKDIYRSFGAAVAWIKKGRNGFDRPVANNTRLVIDIEGEDEFVGIKFHDTYVVKLHDNGDVSFDSGNWRTVSTKDRMSYAGDFQISSDGGIWFISHRRQSKRIERRLRRKYGLPYEFESSPRWTSSHLGSVGPRGRGHGFWHEVGEFIGFTEATRIYRAYENELKEKTQFLFFDGIKFTSRGKCLNGLTTEQEQRKVDSSNRLRERVREYARRAVHHLHDGIAVEAGTPEPWNEITEFDAHYLERIMDEGIFPIRLYYDAMEESQYNDIGRSMHLGERWDEEIGVSMIGGTRPGYKGQRREAASLDTVGNEIYKFMCKRLLPDREARTVFGGNARINLEEVVR